MVPDRPRHLQLLIVNAGATEDRVPKPGRVSPGVVNEELLLGLGERHLGLTALWTVKRGLAFGPVTRILWSHSGHRVHRDFVPSRCRSM